MRETIEVTTCSLGILPYGFRVKTCSLVNYMTANYCAFFNESFCGSQQLLYIRKELVYVSVLKGHHHTELVNCSLQLYLYLQNLNFVA